MKNFDYHVKSTDGLGAFGENASDKATRITFFPNPEFAREYKLSDEIRMERIWSVPVRYPGTDMVNYSINAYEGAGIFAVLDYQHSNFGVFTERPDKTDYEQ